MPKRKIAYITLLDQYHPGIYDSQVIDVIKYWNELGYDTRLYAFLSIKELLRTNAKQMIKSQLPNARVLPAFPKLRWFRLTRFLLAFVLLIDNRRVIVARNVFACTIALWCRKWTNTKAVILDARSAIAAEIQEFDVFPIPYLRNHIQALEKHAVTHSNFRLAVSNALVQYWQKQYKYQENNHVVIPCTLSREHEDMEVGIRLEHDKTSVVYSGSNAPWQGLHLIDEFLEHHTNVTCTLLTKENEITQQMEKKYGDRISIKWLKSEEVVNEISRHDYGLLLRPACQTNKVASPGKFAEYLAAGCGVICSEGIGDSPDFIKINKCGFVWDGKKVLNLQPLQKKERITHINLSKDYFLKSSKVNHEGYLRLLNSF
jgi:glycosyltransferase involved in cell wall biosynthesis